MMLGSLNLTPSILHQLIASGWVIPLGAGKIPLSWALTLKPAPDCTVGMRIFTLWSGSVCWKMATCYIDLPSMTQQFGPSPEVVIRLEEELRESI